MRAFAAWVMSRQVHAPVAAGACGVLGMVIPPLLIPGLAIAALVTMRRGPASGMLVVLGGVMFVAVLVLLLQRALLTDLMIVAGLWLVAWGLAIIYRVSARMSWMMLGAGLVGLMIVGGFYLWLKDPSVIWQSLLDQYLRPGLAQAQLLQSEAELDKLLSGLARVLTGGVAALVSITMIVSLLLARWWQALLFNPGGFREEFHGLQLGKPAAVVMLFLIAASLLGKFAVATDMATVVWLLFFFQGMAVVHALIAQVGMSIAWLVSIYMLLVLVPYYASPVLSGLGFVDTWFDFRRRIREKIDRTEE